MMLGDPNWSSPLWVPRFPTAKPAGWTGRPPEPAALDLDVAPPGEEVDKEVLSEPLLYTHIPLLLLLCRCWDPNCKDPRGVPARRGVHSTRLLTHRGP